MAADFWTTVLYPVDIHWNFQIMDMLGTQHFVLCREVVLFQRLFCTILEHFWFVLCSEVYTILFRIVLYRSFHCIASYIQCYTYIIAIQVWHHTQVLAIQLAKFLLTCENQPASAVHCLFSELLHLACAAAVNVVKVWRVFFFFFEELWDGRWRKWNFGEWPGDVLCVIPLMSATTS